MDQTHRFLEENIPTELLDIYLQETSKYKEKFGIIY